MVFKGFVFLAEQTIRELGIIYVCKLFWHNLQNFNKISMFYENPFLGFNYPNYR